MLKRLQAARQTLAELTRTNYGTFRGWVRHLLGQVELVTGRVDPWVALEPATVHRLVFVCLGNINRSAFAEGVARAQGGKVCSLGLATTTGAPAFELALQTAPRFGIDLGRHAATDIGDYQYREGDLLLVMEIRHARQLLARGIPMRAIALLGAWATPKRIHLHDPHTLSERYFYTCFTLIHVAVINLLAELRQAGSPCVQP
ncbi:arsenate reductase/protein-tyrosine-phosphatase family protein [Chitinimonas sp. BJB300]|uniref:arsenate reductase/protein-tyrosine-phosphatase family protein n=1 Tax=Chitinimonas sp. BJB300 TaxID=1559339 RepID=UPI000C0DB2C6|nr:phosphotyrosine protein phosphatase [Chitinimonas sp. BJB300]PHV12109.1 phosphotyrosine protein phosphatase [Chitinimonas sp. BJB300]TSJ89063.1 phosphotyrosine protein phosphatase [Chitinimonas sp. BJB300]